jgi:hypothetical protein
MKIIILVLSADFEPYISLINCIKETWASKVYPEIEIYYYYGGSEKFEIRNNEIFCPIQEKLENIGYKTIMTFDWLLKNKDFDYIFRTNASSYINQKKLIDFIKDKPKEKFCSGIIGNYNGINFISGSGYFLSKDIVELVINNSNIWDHQVLDDVSLGKILNRFNIKLYSAKRLDIGTIDDQSLDNYINHYHFRCKCLDRNDDIKIMKKIYNLYDKW